MTLYRQIVFIDPMIDPILNLAFN